MIDIKIHENIYYIKNDKWEFFLLNYKDFGFNIDSQHFYPKCVSRITNDGKKIEINISEPCINMWDFEDKNRQREIWLVDGRYGCGRKEKVLPYIEDLIKSDLIER